MTTPADLVNRFMDAVGAGDFAAARACLADDFRFEGPFDTFTTSEPYLAALRAL